LAAELTDTHIELAQLLLQARDLLFGLGALGGESVDVDAIDALDQLAQRRAAGLRDLTLELG
jgi:hypothetical protein